MLEYVIDLAYYRTSTGYIEYSANFSLLAELEINYTLIKYGRCTPSSIEKYINLVNAF